jgi:nitrogen fixation/metabolism regulation signal transduction histidine kinase
LPIPRTFLQTRIARRVFGLFLLCAVVPAVTLAASGYMLVSGEMRSQAGVQLAQASKVSGTLLLARIHAADEELSAAAKAIVHGEPRPEVHERLRSLKSLALVTEGTGSEIVWG